MDGAPCGCRVVPGACCLSRGGCVEGLKSIEVPRSVYQNRKRHKGCIHPFVVKLLPQMGCVHPLWSHPVFAPQALHPNALSPNVVEGAPKRLHIALHRVIDYRTCARRVPTRTAPAAINLAGCPQISNCWRFCGLAAAGRRRGPQLRTGLRTLVHSRGLWTHWVMRWLLARPRLRAHGGPQLAGHNPPIPPRVLWHHNFS